MFATEDFTSWPEAFAFSSLVIAAAWVAVTWISKH